MEEESESEEDEDVVFEKAKEFLEIVRSECHNSTQGCSTSSGCQLSKEAKRPATHFGVPKSKKLKTVKPPDDNVITSSQRKKLERVKIPVTSFKSIPTQNECLEENDGSVEKMLEHLKKLPEKESYVPTEPAMVAIDNEKDGNLSHDSGVMERVEFCYLSSEQDLTTWELLKSSPTNCNIFVGNLSFKIDTTTLLAAFKPFVTEQQQNNVKIRIVTNSLSGVSKGYGFVQFPYRRAAELAMICMQGFQIFDREMQLGWGQEEPATGNMELKKDEVGVKQALGSVISDSQRRSTDSTPQAMSKPKTKSRWDVGENNSCSKKGFSTQKSFQPADQQSGSKKMEATLGNKASLFGGSTAKRPVLKWITKEQRTRMLKSVCENLRQIGVKHHLGVFGVYFNADNSRLFVVCSKTLTEEELKREFEKYGRAVEMIFNKDTSGLSKGSVIFQYETSVIAENAMKELHGKVLGGKPMKIMLAEPKRT